MIARFRSYLQLCMIICVCALLPINHAQAQQSPVTLNVVAGFEGAYRVDEWFPIRVTISNSGPDLKGRIEWRFPGEPRGVFGQDIDLPNGAQKQVTLYVTTTEYSRSGELSFVANNNELVKQSVRLESLASDQLLIGVVSSDPTLLNSLNGVTSGSLSAATVHHFDLATLPEQAQALNSLNVVFIHDLDTTGLNERQHAALRDWVSQGGRLVVGGGSNAVQTTAGLRDVLPVELGGIQQAALTALGTLGQQTSGLPTAATVNSVTLRPGATDVLQQPGSLLLARQKLGSGSITFAAFDLSALRGWAGEPQLWVQVTAPVSVASLGSISRQQRFNLLSEVLKLRALTLIPLWVLASLLALYVLAVGPINYLLLRQFRRLEWAWVSIPLIVFGFVGGIYLTGRLIRGGNAQLLQVAVVQGAEGSNQSMITAYSGLFSPNRARYNFGFTPDTLVQEVRSFDDFGGGSQVIASERGNEVRDSLVDIGAIRTLLSEGTSATDISVQSKLSESGTTIRGDLRYNGNTKLADAAIVRGRAFQSLGSLEPGATINVNLQTDATDYPFGLGLVEQNSVDRQAMLTRLSDISTSNQGFIDQDSTYLIGWRMTTSVAIQINGQPAAPTGVTLYVVRLGSN